MWEKVEIIGESFLTNKYLNKPIFQICTVDGFNDYVFIYESVNAVHLAVGAVCSNYSDRATTAHPME